MAEVTTATSDNFDQEVLKSSLPVIVDFWAPWCAPCLAITPVLESLAREQADKLKVARVNVDEQPELAAQYQIRAIPTLYVFNNGKVADMIIGFLSPDELTKRVEEAIS